MKDLLMKIDMLFSRWNWTDDVADVLWRGKCNHAVVAVSPECEDMEPFLAYAQFLRSCGPWTVAVRQYDFVEKDELQLIQFRGKSLFRWRPAIRTDYFVPSDVLAA